LVHNFNLSIQGIQNQDHIQYYLKYVPFPVF
jgi:hypothetical protein